MARIVLIRHGETEGQSSVRYWGVTDVMLSSEGREQMRVARRQLPDEGFDTIVASPLSRAWQAARIVWPSGAIRLERDFCEIDFGDWEGLTAEQIEARNPAGYREWRESPGDFAFPSGDRRSEFHARVHRGVDRLVSVGFESALVIVHHGVIRAIVEHLTGDVLERGVPELARSVSLSRGIDGRWALSEASSSGD